MELVEVCLFVHDDMHIIQNSWYMDLGYEWLPNILTPSVVKAIPYNMFCIPFCNFFGILLLEIGSSG